MPNSANLVNNESRIPHQFSSITLNLQVDKAQLRHDSMEGRPYLVAPCVMITEGVHAGSMGPLYYPADELSKTPGVWNSKPVVVYHPQQNGKPISACDPVVFSTQRVGLLMNTRFEDGKLRTECWMEESRLQDVDDRVLNALQDGSVMEVSTGLFTDNEAADGEWNGEKYVAIARNYRPDHLAILPDQIGACSVQDGAGLLRNSTSEATSDEDYLALGRTIATLARGAGRGVGKARQQDGGADVCVCTACGKTAPHKRGTPCVNTHCPSCGGMMVGSPAVHNAMAAFCEVLENAMSHGDVYAKLSAKIRTKDGPNEMSDGWISEVWDDFFVYELDGKVYAQNYVVDKDDVKLEGVRQEVTRVVTYRKADGTVVGNAAGNGKGTPRVLVNEEVAMDKEQIVNQLIANQESPWTEDDRETLMGLDEEKLQSIVGNKDKAPEPVAPVAPKAEPESAPAPAVNAAPVTLEQFISNAPAEMREVLCEGLASLSAEKGKLIQSITANARNPFTTEALQAKPMSELRAIAQLAATPDRAASTLPLMPVNYGGMAPVAPVENHAEEPLVMPSMDFSTGAK